MIRFHVSDMLKINRGVKKTCVMHFFAGMFLSLLHHMMQQS